jgi:hypothetical protein
VGRAALHLAAGCLGDRYRSQGHHLQYIQVGCIFNTRKGRGRAGGRGCGTQGAAPAVLFANSESTGRPPLARVVVSEALGIIFNTLRMTPQRSLNGGTTGKAKAPPKQDSPIATIGEQSPQPANGVRRSPRGSCSQTRTPWVATLALRLPLAEPATRLALSDPCQTTVEGSGRVTCVGWSDRAREPQRAPRGRRAAASCQRGTYRRLRGRPGLRGPAVDRWFEAPDGCRGQHEECEQQPGRAHGAGTVLLRRMPAAHTSGAAAAVGYARGP